MGLYEAFLAKTGVFQNDGKSVGDALNTVDVRVGRSRVPVVPRSQIADKLSPG